MKGLGELERSIMDILWGQGRPLTAREVGKLIADRDLARRETALLAATAQGPGPVLGVRLRFHVSQASARTLLAATDGTAPAHPLRRAGAQE